MWNTVSRPFKDYDLWYIWSGRGELILNGEQREIAAGSCFLFRPGDETIGVHDGSDPIIVSYIHFRMPEEAAAAFPSFHSIEDRLAFETYLTRYVYSRMGKRDEEDIEGRMLLYLLLLQYNRESKAECCSTGHNGELVSVIHEVASYAHQFPSMNHSLFTLAERARLSPRYFSRKFKEIMNRTVESYLIDVKIERAEHMLRYDGLNVSETARALGYNNVYYFSRQFKKYRGITPSEVRNR